MSAASCALWVLKSGGRRRVRALGTMGVRVLAAVWAEGPRRRMSTGEERRMTLASLTMEEERTSKLC